jgi:hypothetical protein
MAYVIAAPEIMTAAATDLATIASNVNAAHMVAAAPTLALVPAAADEVSAGIAHLFSQHAANYQVLAGQAAAFNAQFVQHLTAAAFSYADIEGTLANLLQFGNFLSEIGNLIFTGLATAFAADPAATILGVAVFLLLLPLLIPLEVFFFIPLALGGFLVGSLLFIAR